MYTNQTVFVFATSPLSLSNVLPPPCASLDAPFCMHKLEIFGSAQCEWQKVEPMTHPQVYGNIGYQYTSGKNIKDKKKFSISFTLFHLYNSIYK